MRLDHVEVFASQEACQGPSHGVPQMIHHVGTVNIMWFPAPSFSQRGSRLLTRHGLSGEQPPS